jgi:hypothetical protein
VVAPRHHSIDRFGLTLEHRFHAALAPVAHEASDSEGPSLASAAVPEEDPLNTPLDLYPSADRHLPSTLSRGHR